MENLTPRTREEEFLKGAAEGGTDLIPLPDVRREAFLKRLSDPTYPRPEGTKTREEWFLDQAAKGGGGSITVEELDVTENGTYTAPAMTAYNPVNVNVPLPENALLLKDIPSTPTAIATFSDGAEMVMPSLKVAIEPVQEGSGDPSPENVRPISGWDEVNVSVSGVNVWDEEWEVGGLNPLNGETTFENDRIRSKNFRPCKPNMTMFYYIPSGKGNLQIVFYDINKNYLDYYNYSTEHTFTTPNGCYFFKFNTGGSYGTTYNNDISINYPSTDTEYHAYNGTTYTIDLDGTRYGGTLDVVSGVLTVDRIGIKGVNVARVGQTGSGVHYADTTHIYADLVQNTTTISDRYVQINTSQGGESGKFRTYDGEFTIYDDRFTDVATAQDLLNDVEFCYELATPLTVQLTPTAVKSLEGDNNLFADSGEILEGEYLGGVS